MAIAPVHKIPIKIPLMMKESFIFLAIVNSPESSYYWAKGKTSQHMKKLML